MFLTKDTIFFLNNILLQDEMYCCTTAPIGSYFIPISDQFKTNSALQLFLVKFYTEIYT